MATTTARKPGAPLQLGKQIARLFEETFAVLESLAMDLARELASSSEKSGGKILGDSRRVKPKLIQALGQVDTLVFSIGAQTTEGVSEGAAPWGECFERDPDGAIHPISSSVFPWRGAFFDYANAEWMVLPRSGHNRVVVGPFVDYSNYLVTLSCPIRVADKFLGVVTADIKVDDFERAMAHLLAKCSFDCAVVNAESRVVISNSAAFPVGELVDRREFTNTACGTIGWHIVTP